MSTEIIYQIAIVVCALAGFGVAAKIYADKQKPKPMVCPMGGTCDRVVRSKYSQFFGVDISVGGMLYYSLIAVVYTAIMFSQGALPAELSFAVVGLSVGALMFSLYLVGIQAFVLRNWCTWCVISAILSFVIAVLSMWVIQFDLLSLLAQYKSGIVIAHALAAGIGVGATTVTDVLFMRFLADFRIDKTESATMKTYSQIIWLALGVLIITGIGLYLPESERLLQSSKFLVKVCVVLVILLNGLLLNFFVTPKMTKIKFELAARKLTPSSKRVRRIVYASGAVSIISWYVVFVLGSLRSIPVSFGAGVLVYVGLLVCGLVGSLGLEKKLVQRAQKSGITEKNLV